MATSTLRTEDSLAEEQRELDDLIQKERAEPERIRREIDKEKAETIRIPYLRVGATANQPSGTTEGA
jgi:hypothetical protein